MDSSIIVAGIGVISAVVVALIGYFQHSGSQIAEKNSNDFRELIAAQKEQIAAHKADAEQAREVARAETLKRIEVEAENVRLRGENADYRELVADYRQYNHDRDSWEKRGSTPPSPEKSWRLRDDLSAWLKSQGVIGND